MHYEYEIYNILLHHGTRLHTGDGSAPTLTQCKQKVTHAATHIHQLQPEFRNARWKKLKPNEYTKIGIFGYQLFMAIQEKETPPCHTQAGHSNTNGKLAKK